MMTALCILLPCTCCRGQTAGVSSREVEHQTLAGVGIPTGVDGGHQQQHQSGGVRGLPGPPPMSGPGALLAMLSAGIKLSGAQKLQLKGLSKEDRKEAKRARKEAKKVYGCLLGWLGLL